MTNFIRTFLIINSVLLLAACRPEQDAAEFSITNAPTVVDGFHFETMMNNPVEVHYQADAKDLGSSIQIILVTKPKFGELTACQNQDGLWKCIYIPKQDYIGDDFLEFQVKDGDFLSAGLAKLRIRVLEFNYANTQRVIKIPSKASTVCDPLSGGEQAESGKGLAGNIRLLTDPQNGEIRNNLNSFLNPSFSYEVPNLSLFMSKVDVPTRSFDLGFTAQDNQVLSVDGNPLIEYFNVNLKSTIKIIDEAKTGEYELAIISDDGSRLAFKSMGQSDYTTYLESVYTHSPKMLCSISNGDTSNFINFEKDKGIDISINYFQGPRYHIALQLLWRKKDQAQTASALCNNKIDTSNFGILTLEGWSIIPAEVFYLPSGVINTCDEANDELRAVSFSVPVPKDTNLVGLIKNVKIKIKNLLDGSIVELSKDEFTISNGQIDDEEVLFDIDFSSPIVRDTDKEIIVEFDQRVI